MTVNRAELLLLCSVAPLGFTNHSSVICSVQTHRTLWVKFVLCDHELNFKIIAANESFTGETVQLLYI